MQFLILGALLLYVIERILETFWRRHPIQGTIVASYTLYLLVAAHSLVFIATIYEWMNWNDNVYSRGQFVIGLFVIVLALLGRAWSIQTLGPYHSIHIEIRVPHPLITFGPYRFVRNPYYLSNALEIVGLPLLAGSSFGVILALILYWPALWLRMVSEESALQEAIRSPFFEYKLRVPRLLPKL